MTERVPLEVKDDVAVTDPPVIADERSVVIPPVTALRVVAKRFVAVAFVKVAFVAVSEEIKAVVALKSVAKRLVEVAFVLRRLVMVPVVLKSVFAVKTEDEAFPKVVCPVTVRVEAVVVAKVEVPFTVNFPFVRRSPFGAAKKLRFSAQLDPFQ